MRGAPPRPADRRRRHGRPLTDPAGIVGGGHDRPSEGSGPGRHLEMDAAANPGRRGQMTTHGPLGQVVMSPGAIASVDPWPDVSPRATSGHEWALGGGPRVLPWSFGRRPRFLAARSATRGRFGRPRGRSWPDDHPRNVRPGSDVPWGHQQARSVARCVTRRTIWPEISPRRWPKGLPMVIWPRTWRNVARSATTSIIWPRMSPRTWPDGPPTVTWHGWANDRRRPARTARTAPRDDNPLDNAIVKVLACRGVRVHVPGVGQFHYRRRCAK
jgi:hypothetical protein